MTLPRTWAATYQRRVDAANVRIAAWELARRVIYDAARAHDTVGRDIHERHARRVHRQTARLLRIAARLLGAAGSGAE